MASKGGHVFIAQGDPTQLACDAWLLPTDAALNLEVEIRGAPRGLDRISAAAKGSPVWAPIGRLLQSHGRDLDESGRRPARR
jgi:hypothetical protein